MVVVFLHLRPYHVSECDAARYGVLVQFAGGVLGLAVNAHVEAQHKKPAAVGTTVKCRVLYVDFKTSIVDASLLTRLVDGTCCAERLQQQQVLLLLLLN